MIILQLLIAHLLGDFVFQSNALFKKKYESWKGTFQHVLIISAFTILMLFPYWGSTQTWIVVGIIFSVHFFQDLIKVEYDKKFNAERRSVMPFFIDQALHITLIYFLGSQFFQDLPMMEIPTWLSSLYYSSSLNVLVVCILLLTYTFDITLFQFKRHENKQIKIYNPDYIAMMGRVITFGILYIIIFLGFNFFT